MITSAFEEEMLVQVLYRLLLRSGRVLDGGLET